MAWKYFEIKKLSEAKKDENIIGYYPDFFKNVCGKKTEEKIQKAAKDSKEGKCKLLVWREFEKQ